MSKIAVQLTKLDELKRMMVDYLRIKGVVASYDETFNTLIPKILTILQVQGDLTLGAKEITKDGDYFPINDGTDAYSSVSVKIMKDNDALVKFLDLFGLQRLKRVKIKGNIPSYAYNGRADVQEIHLEDCEEIEQYAFNGCNNLATLTNNKVIKVLGQYAFNNCSIMDAEITLDDEIKEIPLNCFLGCGKIQLNLPKNLEIVNTSAFRGCESLLIEKLPENLHTVKDYGFYYCKNLIAKKMPVISSLSAYAFHYSGVQFEEIPKGITLPTYAFNYCNGLTNLKFSNEGIIPNYCFQYCTNLEEIEIGTGITALNTNSFRQCTKLKTIICRNITPPTLVYNAINSCPIEEIYVPASALEVYKSATNWSVYADKMIPLEGE